MSVIVHYFLYIIVTFLHAVRCKTNSDTIQHHLHALYSIVATSNLEPQVENEFQLYHSFISFHSTTTKAV